MRRGADDTAGFGQPIVLQYFDGCPNWRVAQARLRAVLREIGMPERVRLERVDSEADANRLAFRGSPTILVGGVDPFAQGDTVPTGLTCRIYMTESGPRGAPSAAQLRAVLAGLGTGRRSEGNLPR